jgi:hypothetical protein
MRTTFFRALVLLGAAASGACGPSNDHDAAIDTGTRDVSTPDASDSGAADALDANAHDTSSDTAVFDAAMVDAVTAIDASDTGDSAVDEATTTIDASDASDAPDSAADDAVDTVDVIDTPDSGSEPDTGATSTCASDAMCTGGSVCLVGHCYSVSDSTLPTASVPSPDRCRLRIGVDHPSGAPFRVLSVVANSTGDLGYESVLDMGTWSRTMLSSNVSAYDTPRFRRAPSGALENSFIQGTTVYMGSAGGAIMQSGLTAYAAAYGPTGELVVATKQAGTGMFSTPYPLRLWRRPAGTWMSDLVSADIRTDGVGEIHFRSDGTPDVLVFDTTRLTIYRKALDVWNGTLVYTASGTHFGGEFTLPDPAGGSHVIFGTRVFTFDPSVGELTVVYLHLASDGTITRMETLPVGGHGFTLRDATIDLHGNVYVMITAPGTGGRYPTHVVRISPTDVATSVIANFETTTTVCSLAVAPDATMYLAAYTGYLQPVLLRTYAP